MGVDKLEWTCADQVDRKEDKRLGGDRNAWACLSQDKWEIDKLKGVWGKCKAEDECRWQQTECDGQ